MNAAQHVRHGLGCGFPPCCVARWVWGNARKSGQPQARQRGVAWSKDGVEFVPCGVFHKPKMSFAALAREPEWFTVLAEQTGGDITWGRPLS